MYFFLENFEKYPEKKQNLSEKLITGLVLMNVFTDTFYLLADLFQNNIFQNVLIRMSNPLEDIFHSVHV